MLTQVTVMVHLPLIDKCILMPQYHQEGTSSCAAKAWVEEIMDLV